MPRQLTLNLSPDEALDTLSDLLGGDAEIDGIETEIAAAKEHIKELKSDLADALKRRSAISRKLREPDEQN